MIAWVNIGSTSNTVQITTLGTTCAVVPEYAFSYIGSSKKLSVHSGTPNNVSIGTNSTISIADNNWHQVAVVVNNGTPPTFYVDETAVTSTGQIWYEAANPSGSLFYIGDQPSCGSAFSGLIDDVRIYNRALSAAQIAALYNGGK
jgi:hypothetical protein